MPEERKIKHVVQVYQTPLYKNTVNRALLLGLERKQYAQMLLDNCDTDVDFSGTLEAAFVWATSREGHRFWHGICFNTSIPDAI